MTRSTAPKMISTMSRAALCALLGLCLLAGLTPRARAATASSYVVTRTADDTAPGSLRAAIAQVAGTGGTVTFAIPNTDPGYSSTANTDTITLSLGALVVPGSLSIAAPASPAATVVVSGASTSGVFSVTGGTVVFSGLTITKGSPTQGGGGDILNAATLTLTNCTVTAGSVFGGVPGGDILNTGTLTMTGCTVSSGTTFGGDGAGINNSGSAASLTLTNCAFAGNATQFGGNGGGIANGGTLTGTGCSFFSNTGGGNGYSGGGLYNTGTATLNTSSFVANSAGGGLSGGGGGAFSSGTLTLNSSQVFANFTANVGAGIQSSGTLTLSACTVSGNQASRNPNGSGGGLSCSGPVQMTNCLVVNNFGYNVGGMDSGGALTMTNCTFAGNTAVGSPGFGPFAGGLRSGRATLLNDVFSFDTTSPNGPAVVSEIVAASGTAGPTVTYSDVQGGYAGTGNLSADPQFVRNPGTNGSNDTGDEHLLITSPAVHAGTNGPGVPITDIEGTARPVLPARPSIGAYEIPGSASGFNIQGGFLVTGTQNTSTGPQVVAKFLPGTTPAASFAASVSLGDGSVVVGTIIADPTTAGVFDVTVSHTYAAYGMFTVTTTVSGPNNTPAGTVTSTATIQPAQVAVDVTGQVGVNRGGLVYNRATQRYVQTVTITNTSGAALAGPFSLALDGLTPGAALFSPTGTTQFAPPAGSPYQTATATGLAPGASLSLVLQFTYTGAARFGYTPRVLAGPGAR